MISTIRPSLVIMSESAILYKYKLNDKYYIVDRVYNIYEVEEKEYNKCNCEEKIKGKRG